MKFYFILHMVGIFASVLWFSALVRKSRESRRFFLAIVAFMTSAPAAAFYFGCAKALAELPISVQAVWSRGYLLGTAEAGLVLGSLPLVCEIISHLKKRRTDYDAGSGG